MLPARLARVLGHLARLPGVGEKTAMRYAMYLVTQEAAFTRALGDDIAALAEAVRPCVKCGFLADVTPVLPGDPGPPEAPLCAICRDPRRDRTTLCVVARVADLLAIEQSGAMRGGYFVLPRLLSPLEGIGPEELEIERIEAIIRDDGVREVILATPPTVDGEATSLFLARDLAAHGVRITRIASGVPHGGDLEFADKITLGRALEGRRPME